MAIVVSDGSSTHTINDKESKTILGLDFVGNGYGQVESIDKGLPSWNEKNIKNFLYLRSLISSSGSPVSYPCSSSSSPDSSATSITSDTSFRVIDENTLGWLVSLFVDVRFSSSSGSYSTVIDFGFDPSIFPYFSYAECIRTDQLFCERGSLKSSTYNYPSYSHAPGKFTVNFGVSSDAEYYICGNIPVLVFK